MAILSTGKLPFGRPWKEWLDDDRIFREDYNAGINTKLPAINVAESDNAYHIELVAPGFLKSDFRVKLEGDVLQISAESITETTGEEKNYFRKEYHRNDFSRSFTLPEGVQVDAIAAQYDDGILKISVPKMAQQQKVTPLAIKVQ